MRRWVLLATIMVLASWSTAAEAIRIDIAALPLPAPDTERIFTLDPETGALTFGDGVVGARLPAGHGRLVATYNVGGGQFGNVVEIIGDPSPTDPFVIPTDSFPDDPEHTGLSFGTSGIAVLEVEASDRGLSITAAEPLAVPEPVSLVLLAVGAVAIGPLARVHGRQRRERSGEPLTSAMPAQVLPKPRP